MRVSYIIWTSGVNLIFLFNASNELKGNPSIASAVNPPPAFSVIPDAISGVINFAVSLVIVCICSLVIVAANVASRANIK